ncbi:hypothetical protein DB88DRAFT_508035 [Papiliotrema laurentii]|uniref:Uncharacterized protein n=1 Tax=Papiliotrema laurentii TaxID=5418 RepID=A0AAD9FXD1_PAPLA|nr:hypothetical protein DB88DRAFT_508035 [Papiliotrema laurentii]
MPSSSSSSSSSSKAAEEAKRLKEEKHKRDATSSKKEQARAKYQKEAARGTTTVDELVGVADLEKNFFTEGEWQPAWAHVEFDGDACLKNNSKMGKAAEGFFVPAGSILPLGAALPDMTVLKYGGYFPAGTSFQGGVMIPLHARMVNILPEETKDPKTVLEETLCVVQ